MKRFFGFALIATLLPSLAGAQTPPAPAAPPSNTPAPQEQRPERKPAEGTMSFEEYEPKSTLVVPQHPHTRAKYPFIDVHNHQRVARMTAEDVAKLVADMDSINLSVMVNLSGGTGEDLQKSVAGLKGPHPKRFVTFANVDFRKIDEPDFGENAARQLEQDVKAGAQGLKIYKNLGMFLKDASGKRVPTDDPRLDPVWRKCAASSASRC